MLGTCLPVCTAGPATRGFPISLAFLVHLHAIQLPLADDYIGSCICPFWSMLPSLCLDSHILVLGTVAI